MDEGKHVSRRLAKLVAYFQRAFRRALRRRPDWGTDVEGRALVWLGVLSTPSQRLSFRANLETLACEYDLFVEEYAIGGHGLALQARVFQLAKEFPAAAAICSEMNGPSLMSQMFASILTEAESKRATTIRIALSEEASIRLRAELALSAFDKPRRRFSWELGVGCSIFFIVNDQWVIAGQLPPSQAEELHGLLRRVEAVGYQSYRPCLRTSDRLPDDLQIEWESKEIAKLIIPDQIRQGEASLPDERTVVP